MPICAFCNAEGATKLCGACNSTNYCNQVCQKAHWKQYKLECCNSYSTTKCVHKVQQDCSTEEAMMKLGYEEIKAKYGEHHFDTLRCSMLLGNFLLKRRRFEAAKLILNECIRNCKSAINTVSDPINEILLDAMNFLGYIERELGNYSAAEEICKEQFDKSVVMFGANDPKTIFVMSNLGYMYSEQNNFIAAENIYSECLEIHKKVLGDYHVETLEVMDRLALVTSILGRKKSAGKLLTECFNKRKNVLGSDHPDTLASMANVAMHHDIMGRMVKAEELYKECFDRRRLVLGTNHPDTLWTEDCLKTDQLKRMDNP